MDIKKIRAIVDLVKESGITELEITEGEEKLKISSFPNVLQPQVQQPYITHQILPNQTTIVEPIQKSDIVENEATKSAATQPENLKYIVSPMVGTFYGAPSPSKPPFVKVGQQIKIGQVLCIIEAMKLMNQIESDQDGVIKEILIKDGTPVEFGQQLFVIE
jgi:acetyl-CoA carboxylase biotin carboxyl carrier protein